MENENEKKEELTNNVSEITSEKTVTNEEPQKENKTNNKGNKLKIILIIIVFAALCFYTGYTVANQMSADKKEKDEKQSEEKKEEKKEEQGENQKEEAVNHEELLKIMPTFYEGYKDNQTCTHFKLIDSTFMDRKVTANDVDAKTILATTLRNLNQTANFKQA